MKMKRVCLTSSSQSRCAGDSQDRKVGDGKNNLIEGLITAGKEGIKGALVSKRLEGYSCYLCR